MARILITWELGLNLGHIMPQSWLARALRARGHSVVYCLKEAARAEPLLAPDDRILQAPLPERESHADEPLLNYTDILRHQGWENTGQLDALLHRWLDIFAEVKPDLILADHAPTALLAARCAGLPGVPFGIGFLIPPRQSPMPLCQWWQPSPPRALLRQRERSVLASVNEVLAAHGHPPLECVADSLASPVRALVTTPELDDYPERPDGETYFGLQAHPGGGSWPDWPAGNGPRLLGYLQAGYPGTRQMLEALRRLPVRALLYIPDAPAAWQEALAGSHIRLADSPLDIRRGAQDCDGALSYASIGFMADLLAAGKPLLVAPPYIQHAMVAQRVLQAGAAVPGEPDGSVSDYKAAIEELIESASLRRQAEALGTRLGRYPRGETVDQAVAAAVETLL